MVQAMEFDNNPKTDRISRPAFLNQSEVILFSYFFFDVVHIALISVCHVLTALFAKIFVQQKFSEETASNF